MPKRPLQFIQDQQACEHQDDDTHRLRLLAGPALSGEPDRLDADDCDMMMCKRQGSTVVTILK